MDKLHRGKILSRIQVRGQKFLENGEIVKDLAQFGRRPVSALFQRKSATHLPTVHPRIHPRAHLSLPLQRVLSDFLGAACTCTRSTRLRGSPDTRAHGGAR